VRLADTPRCAAAGDGQDESTMADKQASDIQTDSVGKTACNKCGHVMDLTGVEAFTTVECPKCQNKFAAPGRLGSLVLLKLLGKGEMGATYKAYEKGLGRNVAVKVMLKTLGEDRQRVDAFFAEARAVASLEHPNTVRLYSAGQEKGQPYLVMELIKGKGVDRAFTSEKPMEEAQALEIGIGVAKALAAAGAIGLVHGDIKPANIMLDEKGTPKLVDFGIARFSGGRAGDDQIVGTPYYVAPEQVRREPVDWRADEYSLGATLFHAITGSPPFPGTDVHEVLQARLASPAPDVRALCPGAHPRTAALLARMLDAEPANRHETYRDLLEDLQQAYFQVTGLHTPEMQEVVGRPVIHEAQRVKTPWHWIIMGVAAAVVGVGGAVWAIAFRGDRPPRVIVQSQPAGPAQVAAPVFTPPARPISDANDVQITCQDAKAIIRYTLDGAEPVEASPAYDKPVPVKPGMTLRARAFRQGHPPSQVTDALYAVASAGATDVTTVGEAVRAQTAADEAWERVARVDGGKGLAARMAELDTRRTNAKGYLDQKAHPLALKAYKELSKELAGLEQEWKKATDARKHANATMAAMKLPGARPPAGQAWTDADAMAAKAFEGGDFAAAATQWELVDRLLAEPLEQLLGDVRQRWNQAKANPNVPTLKDRAKGVWDQAEALAGQAGQAELAKQTAEAVVKYHQATVLAAQASQVAQNVEVEARRNQLLVGARDLMNKREFTKALEQLNQSQEFKADPQVAGLREQIKAQLYLDLDMGEGGKWRFVYIPPGNFQMGSPESEAKRGPNEKQHEVTLTKPFYMGVHEVTHGQFQFFLKDIKDRQPPFKTEAEKGGGAFTMVRGAWGPTKGARWDNAGFGQNGQQPVVCVSWNDAQEFCRWATGKAHRKVRLPTEAEWEYACRAGTKTAFSCGDNEDALGGSAWYEANGKKTTHPVGQKAPNTWELRDMHGNVLEWCQDVYEPYPAGPVTDPPTQEKGKTRVVRGGAWDKLPAACRSAARASFADEYRAANLGFRVVVE
jgi:formylglycine-generating enzyme required for sulfatase activity/predicted Ser/Thr protein kinase